MCNKHLIVIVGPTAVGKTALCVSLAKHLETVILSADSRQFYKEMSTGTAKPTQKEMQGVPHHFVNNRNINQEYNAGQFEHDAISVLDNIFEKNDAAILTGGSGLYINAVCDGIDDIPSSVAIRKELDDKFEKEGLEKLVDELKKVDPMYYEVVDKNNPHRVIRALEVYRNTGRTYSSYRTNTRSQRPFSILKIGLDRPREELYQRIDNRMDLMIEAGLFKEAEKLYPYKAHNALQTVGYKEVFDYLDGQYDHNEAIRLLKRNSRRYAKRQLTWFRKDEEIHWFHPDNYDEIVDLVEKEVITPK